MTGEGIREVDIRDIRPYDRNPRNNEASVPKVAASIREFGFLQPIVCDRSGVILAGHTRYAAAKSLGLRTVPVLYAGGLTPEQARAYRLADNKAGEESQWLDDVLSAELEALETAPFDMADFGFEESDEERRRKSWTVTAKKCGLVPDITLRKKCGYLYTTFYKTGRNGRPITQIKEDPSNVRLFADSLCDYLLQTLGGNLAEGGWCICTTPRRRHKEGFHFSTEICRDAAGQLGITFYEDAVTARNRGRLEPEFVMEKDPAGRNVILYDDILTTGITMRETRQMLLDKGHTVITIAAIRN
jgi:hypothetical protein